MSFLPPLRRAAVALVPLTAALAAGSPASAQRIADPDLFAKSAQAAQQALAQYGRWEDAAALQRVVDLGYRIAQESGFSDVPFTFHLLDMAVPNAFALPGGHIFVTRGMIELGLDDDMLAALLGHEIAHVVQRHGLRMQRRATLLNALGQALLVGVLVGASDDRRPDPVYDPFGRNPESGGKGDLIQGTAAASMVVSELLLRSYSREFEDEADEEGQRWSAAAGFDPSGARQLMGTMSARLPESREYGYWRTHPFLEDRAATAGRRQQYLKRQDGSPADAFRQRTQEALLAHLRAVIGKPLDPEVVAMVKDEALAAWPQGVRAEELRLEKLQQERDFEMAKRPLYQDFGRLVASHRQQAVVVAGLTPASPLLATLERVIAELEARRGAILDEAVAVLDDGIYETEFLQTFLSNFPQAAQSAEAALHLGDAYSRLGRQTDAVEQYLAAVDRDGDGSVGHQARRGLRNLAPVLSQLGALQQLARREDDPQLRELSARRLGELVSTYNDLANGAEYLRRFPGGDHASAVSDRLNSLADGLYGEVVLYQTVGDHVKALDRIQRILTYAPLSPAAERLRDRAVLES